MNNFDYPEGADTAEAPWNQPDAVEKPYWVTLQVRITALDEEDAIGQVDDWLVTAKINGRALTKHDHQVDEARVDE